MKLATKILSLLVMIGLATFYMGCDKGGGDDKTEEEIQLSKLIGTFNIVSAVDDSGPRTDFTGMQLIISGTFAQNGTYNYYVTGTLPNPSPWPKHSASQPGSWRFGNDPSADIIRDPGGDSETDMTYTISDDGTLSLSFTVSGSGWAGGRTESVTGNWTFVFDKQ